jgi:hypothetical protein
MPTGTAVNRQWIVITREGSFVIDWGDGLFQDLISGEFVPIGEADISHHPTESELDWLMHIDRVSFYDSKTVYIHNLPERPQRTID